MSCQGYGGQKWKGGSGRLECFRKKQVLGRLILQVLSLRHKLDIIGRLLERHRARRSSGPEEGLLAGRRIEYSYKDRWLNQDSTLTHLTYQDKREVV